ncbi:alginate lyase family protein [Galbibacter sp. BG1]|uniref:alginate lyase family protein n=1 Tax=Galbibacter sp. BG1 TaxID=1170699 RepID=UPI0015BDC290|nr:alginate lyase family protein [Galbibacter sp. BG1]QLE02364.1 alginate lyase family protein [Galbibacter sp. BG1]
MDRNRIILLINTIKHLKLKQLFYQLFYRIRNKIFKKSYNYDFDREGDLIWQNKIFNDNSYKCDLRFSFLNIDHIFEDYVDWNYSNYGKLWTYNLNYFDFLNQNNISSKEGLQLIYSYIENTTCIIDGKEPYPISLRGINWIKFLSQNKIEDIEINNHLFNNYKRLLDNLEYHILGNHLLENGFSLYFGAFYFKEDKFYRQARKILINELDEQILSDGAHFELSPMYHKILLYRLLDCIQLTQNNEFSKDDLLRFLISKAELMLGWLDTISYSNGDIPLVNDSTNGIAPSSKDLFYYAEGLGIKWMKSELNSSGYRKFVNSDYELFIDVGEIGPSYQPGHAHSDTFSFELYVRNQPVIVDTGISTYEKNELRQKQRSTSSHNTVELGSKNQSEVWGGFRVGDRANIVSIKEKECYVEASHDGYKKLGLIHTRSFEALSRSIIIKDYFSKYSSLKKVFHLHFHPDISFVEVIDNEIKLIEWKVVIKLRNALNITKTNYKYALGFNLVKEAWKLEIEFDRELMTIIEIS